MRYPERITEDLQLGSEVFILPTGNPGVIVLINTYEDTNAPYLVECDSVKVWLAASDFVAIFRGWEY